MDESVEQNATGMLPEISDTQKSEIEKKASAFVSDIQKINVNSPELLKKVEQVQEMGRKEILSVRDVSDRLLDRRMNSGAKGSPEDKVSNGLADLRNTMEELDPEGSHTVKGRALGLLRKFPGGKHLARKFYKMETAKEQINHVIDALDNGRAELKDNNDALAETKKRTWQNMLKLREYAHLTESLVSETEAAIAKLKADGKTEEANTLSTTILFEAKQRQQDIMTNMLVYIHAYRSIDIIRQNNTELMKGVERAESATVPALEIAVTVSQALSTQKSVADRMTALNDMTNQVIATNGKLMKDNSVNIQKQAISSGIDAQVLRTAFDDLFATLDEIDTSKQQRNQEIDANIQEMRETLGHARGLEKELAAKRKGGANNSPSLPRGSSDYDTDEGLQL